MVEHESAQQAATRDVLGMVERKSAQQAAAREEPEVQERKSRQHAAARLNKAFKMAHKYVTGQYIFHQPCSLWNAVVFTVVGTFIFQVQCLGAGK